LRQSLQCVSCRVAIAELTVGNGDQQLAEVRIVRIGVFNDLKQSSRSSGIIVSA